MRDKLAGQKAVESFLASEFPRWRIDAQPDAEGIGLLFQLFDERSIHRHILGITYELLVAYATAEDLHGFLSRLEVRENLAEHGSRAAWLSTTGWQ